jgi:hypothetical protein
MRERERARKDIQEHDSHVLPSLQALFLHGPCQEVQHKMRLCGVCKHDNACPFHTRRNCVGCTRVIGCIPTRLTRLPLLSSAAAPNKTFDAPFIMYDTAPIKICQDKAMNDEIKIKGGGSRQRKQARDEENTQMIQRRMKHTYVHEMPAAVKR